jgi:hypothetical protein
MQFADYEDTDEVHNPVSNPAGPIVGPALGLRVLRPRRAVGCSLYDFVLNEPTSLYDPFGLNPDDGSKGRVNPHRKKRPSCWQRHSAAQGRPKAGARSGKVKPNMAQNRGCGCGGAFFALYLSICEMADMYPGCPPLPDENGNCPYPYTAVRHELIFGFYYITCEAWA